MRVNHFNGLLVGLALTLVASGCSTAPTAVPADPAPVVHPVQQLEPAGGAAPLAAAPLAASPCNPCDGIGAYGGAPYYPYTGIPLPGYATFFDPFAVVGVGVGVSNDVRPANTIRDTNITINGDNNTVIIKQGGRGGGRINGMDVTVDGDGNVVKVQQGRNRKDNDKQV